MTLVTVKDSSAKAHYQYINYKRTVYRQSAEKKILPGTGTRLCNEAHKNTEKFAIFIQCHINIVKLNTFIKLFSATNILK